MYLHIPTRNIHISIKIIFSDQISSIKNHVEKKPRVENVINKKHNKPNNDNISVRNNETCAVS